MTQDVDVLRWGVLGTAGINGVVIPAIQASEHGVVTAIASRSLIQAETQAQRFDIATAYEGYEQLLADPQVDVVYIPLPNHLHYQWVLAAAAAGKHILCEKPMAVTAAEAAEMAAAAASAGVLLAEGFMYGHHPRYDLIRNIAHSGEIGQIRSISASFTFDASAEMDLVQRARHPGGGALYDVGCYLTHVARLVLGSEPTAVTMAAQWAGPHGEIDMMTAGLVEFGDIPLLMRCAMWSGDEDRVQILGTAGQIVVPSAFFCAPGAEGFTLQVGEQVREVPVPVVNHFTEQADDLARAVLFGDPQRYPSTDAAANLAVIEACLLSARRRERVLVVPPPTAEAAMTAVSTTLLSGHGSHSVPSTH